MSVSPPRPKPLPLTALRAFEAAARLGGFSAAAQELGVTPGAISAQIKTLEEEIGAPLFRRNAQGVALTPLGQRILPEFTDAFDQLTGAVQLMRDEAAPKVVHIATLPSIAQFWLSPRLPALRAAMPDISISITALEQPPNLKRTPYDLCLFFAPNGGEEICPDVILPVCAPDVARLLTAPADLNQVPCLTDTTWESDWELWLQEHAPPDQAVSPRGPVYSLYGLAVEEALNGAGVLIGHKPLLDPLLKSGRLVAPFPMETRLPISLRLWALPSRRPASATHRVMKWLRCQADPSA